MKFHKIIDSIKMKTVGAVWFIHLLLLIAGVEPNPGPTDKLVFRYQYLLIEVGTQLLRKLFDIKVGNDLMQFLRRDTKAAQQLKFLIDQDIITADQQIFLPPKDNNPDTANYDITLLTCLLRNICGLKHNLDPVWKNPASTDLTVEADITRLRECRNYVVHKGTVHISESDFNQKWSELVKILHRLNNFCGVPNLTEMIDEVYNKPLDDQLKQQYDNILKAWNEAESLFEKEIDHLKIGQSEIKEKVKDLSDGLDKNKQQLQNIQEENKSRFDNIEQACASNKRIKLYTDSDIKESLRKSYGKYFRTACVTPLYSEDDRLDMLTVYARPKMEHVPYHKSRQSEGNYDILSYERVFSNENTVFRYVFITGDAGMGKTYFAQFMSLLWSKAIAGDIVGDKATKNDARFMTHFDFVFYIPLKETNREDVVSMIVDKHFYTSSKNEFEETIKTIEQILRTQSCLVILDGLDEWRPDIGGRKHLPLPRKVTSDCDRCTYLITCRPHIIETDRLSEMDIDHQVQVTGFDHKKYIREVIGYLNNSQNTNKGPDDFLRQIKDSEMDNQLHIPLITSQLIVVWLNYEMSNMNRAMIYGSIVDMLFARAIKNEIKFPSMASSDVHLPESFSRFTDLQKYVGTLEKVCRLSFLLLFDLNNKTPSLVFTNDQLLSEPYNISSEEIDFLCQLGIISKNKVIASFGKQTHLLSFLHMSYLEFLAALFVSLYDKTDLFRGAVKKYFNDNLGKYVNFLGKYENFLILLSGISSHLTSICFETIYMEQKEELDLQRSKIHFYRKSTLDPIQDIILYCLTETRVSDNSQRFIKLEDFNMSDYNHHKNFQDLKALLEFNKYNVKSLIAREYLDEFNAIKGLQYLMIGSTRDVRFNDVMLHNQSTLHCLTYSSGSPVFVLFEFSLRGLPNLTSIVFTYVWIEHDFLQDLMRYISGNILLKNIDIYNVKCCEHKFYLNRCTPTLNLSGHSKLLTLYLYDFNVECSGINTSCLTSLALSYSSDRECPRLMNVVHFKQNSKLKCLYLHRACIPHSEGNRYITAIKCLKYLERLTLYYFTIPDSVSLQIHPDIICDKYIDIKLYCFTMSDRSFQDFIDCVVYHQSIVRVKIISLSLSSLNLDTIKNKIQALKANPSVRIKVCNYRNISIRNLEFETIK